MAFLGSAIQGIGGLVGAGLNYFGARQANAVNMRMAREQMGFQTESADRAMSYSDAQAQRQMEFQERMSNTAYQRAVADMEAAGLNPILAFQQGGASTPSGSSGQAVAAGGAKATVFNQHAAAVSTALQSMALGAQIEQTRALTKLMEADLPEKRATGDVYDTQAGRILKWVEKILDPVTGAAAAASRFMPYMNSVRRW